MCLLLEKEIRSGIILSLTEQDGSMVFTGDEVVVDLTGYVQ